MKKYLVLTLSAAWQVCALFAQQDTQTPYLTKSISGDAINTVNARTQGGSIAVTGGAGADARIEVYVWGNNGSDLSKDEIKQRLSDDYTLEVTVANHQLTAFAKPKHDINNWRKSLNISFKIYVPAAVSTDLETSGGSITLSDLSGDEKFSTSGGSLHIDNLAGKTVGSTSGGSIHVSNSKDFIDLTTSGGSIEASNCSGTIKLGTSGGSLHLNNLKGTIHAGTSGGSAEGDNIEGELTVHTSGSSIHLTNLACSLDASTSGAGIDAEIVKLGQYVKLNTSGGSIDLTIPQGKGVNLNIDANRIRSTSLSNFSGSQERGRMNGTLNGGGVPVTLSTSGGEVSFATK